MVVKISIRSDDTERPTKVIHARKKQNGVEGLGGGEE